MTEYKWEPHHAQELGVAGAFRLEGVWPYPGVKGYLKKGSKKCQGWFVYDVWALPPITRLPHTLTEDEAKDTAKMILLSLKQTGSEGRE